jgi:hypothetical protein
VQFHDQTNYSVRVDVLSHPRAHHVLNPSSMKFRHESFASHRGVSANSILSTVVSWQISGKFFFGYVDGQSVWVEALPAIGSLRDGSFLGPVPGKVRREFESLGLAV